MKAKTVIDNVAKGIPYVTVIDCLLTWGRAFASNITDEDIDAVVNDELKKIVVKATRELAKSCNNSDIVRLIKAEWCCIGEVYDPDLDQFVTDLEHDE